MNRPPIPADIRRAVLVEAGHRCAIPHCGEKEIDIHHIVPWESCKKHEYSNLIALCVLCHRRAHSGEIDRKALFIYKQRLISAFGNVDFSQSNSQVIETVRRIKEINEDSPGYYFEFDFPDFPGIAERIVSKNIEAWGYEFLSEYRDRQEEIARIVTEGDAEESALMSLPSTLSGRYSVVRRDEQLISLRYTIYRYYTGAAHGGLTTRVQNYFLKPFSPITIHEISGNVTFPALAELVRDKLAATGKYDADWLARGTEPNPDNFRKFVIDESGINFIFGEYQIAAYVYGQQEMHVPFTELSGVCSSSMIDRLIFIPHDKCVY